MCESTYPYPGPPHSRSAIEDWISTVSKHPPFLAMASPLGFPDSDDKIAEVPQITIPNQRVVKRPEKRSRANSSPLAENMRVFHDRSATPFAPPSTRDPSPASTEETQAESASSGRSDVDSNFAKGDKSKHRNKAAVSRATMKAEEELGCLDRIKKSTSLAYANFHDPTVVYKETGSPTHNSFKCKHCGRVVERIIGVSYTSGLTPHSLKCSATTKQDTVLGAYGITGGNPATLMAEQVREYFALCYDLAMINLAVSSSI
ncbi:hypothetical protein BDV93DRAFT_514443 [Ceratobasidium sp. AG-I]|nr:hypothetical protein BDV93DRAFT_514443 [Ceratobasidium sp. AG-I]